jgi:hypothetical protein
MVDPGESVSVTLKREFMEEAMDSTNLELGDQAGREISRNFPVSECFSKKLTKCLKTRKKRFIPCPENTKYRVRKIVYVVDYFLIKDHKRKKYAAVPVCRNVNLCFVLLKAIVLHRIISPYAKVLRSYCTKVCHFAQLCERVSWPLQAENVKLVEEFFAAGGHTVYKGYVDDPR